MFNTKSKKERSLKTPLFLKPFRSAGSKSAINRRPNPPGQHGAKRKRAKSEFAGQLSEKQKFKYTYSLRESQLIRIFKEASKNPDTTGPTFVSLLERRLDNVVFRLGLAPSRSVARQMIGHGHIHVNSRRVKASAYRVRPNDVISIRPESRNKKLFQDLLEGLEKYEAPIWLSVDAKTYSGKVVSFPKDFDIPFDISKVVDYYSKTAK
jgi:small subunit ribosomal protein S4